MRLMKGLRGTVSAWWALSGLVVTTFAFLGVNMFLSGLHSYGDAVTRPRLVASAAPSLDRPAAQATATGGGSTPGNAGTVGGTGTSNGPASGMRMESTP